MEQDKLIGMVIGGIAVVGGMVIAALAIAISVPWSMKEKLAKLDAQTKERLALIEKGIDPELIFKKEKRSVGQDPLFWGFLCAGLGLGVFLGYILSLVTRWDGKVLTNSLGIFLAGLGMISYRVYYRRSGDQRPV